MIKNNEKIDLYQLNYIGNMYNNVIGRKDTRHKRTIRQ